MILMNGDMRRGFTLIELLVVVGMIAVILGAITTSVSSAQGRARIQKATADVKVITQAILSYESFSQNSELPVMDKAEAGADTLGFLLGNGGTSKSGDKIPALLMASLRGGGKLRDPWGHPYLVTIRKTTGSVTFKAASSSMQTGYMLPNFYRLSKDERNIWSE